MICEGFFVQLLVKLIVLKMSFFGSDAAASLSEDLSRALM